MLRRSLYYFIFSIILATLILMFLNRGRLTIDFSGEEGTKLLDHKTVNNVVDFYVDGDGNYYYLDYYETETYMYKVSSSGAMVFKEKLPKTIEDKDQYYKKIIAAEDGFIYTSVTVTPKGVRNISKEIIKKYDSEGNYLEDIYEIYLEEPMRLGNPFSAFSGRLLNIQLIEENLYAFDKRSDQEVALLKISLAQEIEGEAVDKKILNLNTSILREMIYTTKGDVYFLNRQAEIYRINKYGTVEKLELAYDGVDVVIPYTLSADSMGHIYFTDVYNKNFVQHSYLTRNIQTLYPLNQVLDEEKKITLDDLRNIKVFNGNKVSGHSMVGLEGANFIATLKDGEARVLDKVKLDIAMVLPEYGLLFALILAGFLLLALLFRLFSGGTGLVTKQIFIFLPVFLAIMFSLVFLLTNVAREYTIDSTYEKVSAVAVSTTNLIDVDKFKNLNHPGDDLGSDFVDIAQKVRVGMGGIYYVTYFVEDEQIFVGVASTLQSYTPIEYLYDDSTVRSYYRTLRTGEIELGTTIDSLGEWMFALAPIRDSAGQIIGIIEQGVHADLIHGEINDAQNKLILVVIGIALLVVLIYIVMLKHSLRSLKVLKLSVSEIAAGRWDTKVDIQTKDEFRDIGLTFNKMSNHIQEYIEEITDLNRAYIKFVPEKFINLLGKKSVLDVSMGEQVMEQMSIMYINIRNIEHQAKQMDIKENYNFINRVLEMIARTVDDNGGVIERFEGAGAMALFKSSSEQAILASLSLIEELELFNQNSKRQVELGVTISNGQVLLGIVGHENRLGTTVISDEVQNTHALEMLGAKLAIKLLVTLPTLSEIANLEKYHYRYAGRVKDNNELKTIEIYEFLDNYGQEDKNVKLMTKSLLEEGIEYYQAGEFFDARNRFIDVIRTDRNDELAKAYLFLCEKYNGQELSNWEGVLEYS